MKLRIVKKYWSDNTSYYIVQQKKIFRWGVPNHDVLYDLGFFGVATYKYYKCFESLEEAEVAANIAKLSHELKDEVIKEL